MVDSLAAVETVLRFGAFLGVFVLVALWEVLASRRPSRFTRAQRWPHNLGLIALNAGIVRLVAPGAAIAVALAGEAHGWGLFNVVTLPSWAAILLGVVLLDLAIYFQHVLFHAVPALWRLHRVHHSVIPSELNSNFGFNLPWWDHVFGTYRAQPAAGHEAMRIGVDGLQGPEEVRLTRLLTQPLRGVSPSIALTDQHADIVSHS